VYKCSSDIDVVAVLLERMTGLKASGSHVTCTNGPFCDRIPLQLQPFHLIDSLKRQPYQYLKYLFEAQHSYIGTIFSLVEPESFDLQLQQVLNGPREGPNPSDRDACLVYSKVLVVLAFGEMYSLNQMVGDGPPGFEYFIHALQYLPDVHEGSSILFVETIALIGYFFQILNEKNAAFLYIGDALRMAISLGLHQEVTSSDLDDITEERRRRVWWSVYSLDRILSVKSGHPITIQDEDIVVALPSRLPHEPHYCSAIVLRHYTQLSIILGRIGTTLYRKTPESGSDLMASVQDIMTSLSKWHREIPDELRFDTVNVTRESVSTLVHYYQCINMTVRQLLFHVVQQRLKEYRHGTSEDDWKHGLDPSAVAVIKTCIFAAQDTISMMTIAAEKGLVGKCCRTPTMHNSLIEQMVATYGYMDGEHIFSAALVLVMVCLSFPSNSQNTAAMKAALEIFKRLSGRGNAKALERYILLRGVLSIARNHGRDFNDSDDAAFQVDDNNFTADSAMAAFPLVDNSELPDLIDQPTNAMNLDFWINGYTNPELNFGQDMPDWMPTGESAWDQSM
jgi:proline utilization trans-activator